MGKKKPATSGGRFREVTYLEPDEAEALKKAAELERCTKAEILRRALRQYVNDA